jgi:hypothetical protein
MQIVAEKQISKIGISPSSVKEKEALIDTGWGGGYLTIFRDFNLEKYAH